METPHWAQVGLCVSFVEVSVQQQVLSQGRRECGQRLRALEDLW